MIHTALTLPRSIAANRSTAFRPGLAGDAPGNSRNAARCRGGPKFHVRGKLVRQAADFAPAHRVRLAGERERSHARLADAAGEQVAVDDAVDLVGAGGRLVHALRKGGDDRSVRAEQLEELEHVVRIEAAVAGNGVRIGAVASAVLSAASKPLVCARRSLARAAPLRREVASRPLNSHTSVPGATGRCRSATFARGGAARIDHDDLEIGPRSRSVRRACAGTAPDGTRRCSSPPARSGRRARGRRSSPAPGPRRTRACDRRPRTTCTAANWCRCWRCRCSPSSACWRRSSLRSAAGRTHRTRRYRVHALDGRGNRRQRDRAPRSRVAAPRSSGAAAGPPGPASPPAPCP